MFPFERFKAWQACYVLLLAIYKATKSFPRDELYGLTSQCRRAAFSAVANIAEGSAKRGRREFARFLDISIGSLSELGCALLVTRDLKITTAGQWRELEALRARAGLLTWKLYASMRDEEKGGTKGR
jgi:four helix bundle protein